MAAPLWNFSTADQHFYTGALAAKDFHRTAMFDTSAGPVLMARRFHDVHTQFRHLVTRIAHRCIAYGHPHNLMSRTSTPCCANLRLELRQPRPRVAQTCASSCAAGSLQSATSSCAHLRLGARKPPPRVAQTSASGCANLQVRLRSRASRSNITQKPVLRILFAFRASRTRVSERYLECFCFSSPLHCNTPHESRNSYIV